MVDIYVTNLLGRRLLVIGKHVIPIDRIVSLNLDAPNGGCNNAVRIVTDDPDDDYIWAYENADAIREFLLEHKELP